MAFGADYASQWLIISGLLVLSIVVAMLGITTLEQEESELQNSVDPI